MSLRVSRLNRARLAGAPWKSACLAAALGLALAGCAGHTNAEPDDASFLARPYESTAPVSELDREDREDLHKAQTSFARKAYGLAEKHFRAAIERDRDNAEAWLGLAASYDQLARYDLADRAYDRLERLNVDRAVVLNNRGYSHILRGDYTRARNYLIKAQSIAPEDARISRNLALLDTKQITTRGGANYK